MFHGVTIIDDNDLRGPGAMDVTTSHDVALELLADGQSYAVVRQRGGVDAYVKRSCATEDVLAEARAEAARLESPRAS